MVVEAVACMWEKCINKIVGCIVVQNGWIERDTVYETKTGGRNSK